MSPVDADCPVTSLLSLVHENVTSDDTDDVHVKLTDRAAHRGIGATGEFCPGSQPERSPGGPLNTCLKDRYTLIEQSDLDTLIEQSQYSSEEQCSKLINKEIWLVRHTIRERKFP